MKTYKFSDCNAVFKLQGCFDVPAVVTKDADGNQIIISGWLPSVADKISILKGCPLHYLVRGGFPPMNLYTINDQNEINPDNIDVQEETDELQKVKDYFNLISAVSIDRIEDPVLNKVLGEFGETMGKALQKAIDELIDIRIIPDAVEKIAKGINFEPVEKENDVLLPNRRFEDESGEVYTSFFLRSQLSKDDYEQIIEMKVGEKHAVFKLNDDPFDSVLTRIK